MSNKKSLVEEAIIQMKNLEETVAQNAKGILASTMKKEIKDLVKESIVSEEDDEEIDTNVKMDMDTDSDEDDVEIDMDVDSDEDDTDMDMNMDSDKDDMDMDMDVDSNEDDMDEPIDLTKHSDEEVMKVFKLMGPNDQIIVTKDNSGNINLKDGGNDTEYMLVGENEEEYYNQEMSEDDDTDMDDGSESSSSFDTDGNFMGMETPNGDMETTNDSSIEDIINDVFGSSTEMEEQDVEDDEDSEVVYEIEMDEEDDSMEMDEDDDSMEMEEEDEEYMSESKMSIKPKGVGMGSPKFKYSSKPNQGQGFKTKMKQGNLKMGTGKPKFEFKEGENLDMEMTEVKPKFKKFETKEASRTYGNGSKSGRGLRKGITPNRNLTFESKTNNEIQILREKNEEYRKALNVFRNKLTEVAVFNSNLAYATRLFTEHTTSKHEKINILRRFDGVESIKESKNLYKSIKDELLNTTNQTMNESIERKIENTPVTGSVNLIESKTYENPQFARMKDLMSKIK
jgi:hypothetical protein